MYKWSDVHMILCTCDQTYMWSEIQILNDSRKQILDQKLFWIPPHLPSTVLGLDRSLSYNRYSKDFHSTLGTWIYFYISWRFLSVFIECSFKAPRDLETHKNIQTSRKAASSAQFLGLNWSFDFVSSIRTPPSGHSDSDTPMKGRQIWPS